MIIRKLRLLSLFLSLSLSLSLSLPPIIIQKPCEVGKL